MLKRDTVESVVWESSNLVEQARLLARALGISEDSESMLRAAQRGQAFAYASVIRSVASFHKIARTDVEQHLDRIAATITEPEFSTFDLRDFYQTLLNKAIDAEPAEQLQRVLENGQSMDLKAARYLIGDDAILFTRRAHFFLRNPTASEATAHAQVLIDAGVAVPLTQTGIQADLYSPEVIAMVEEVLNTPAGHRLITQDDGYSIRDPFWGLPCPTQGALIKLARDVDMQTSLSVAEWIGSMPGGNAERDWPVFVEYYRLQGASGLSAGTRLECARTQIDLVKIQAELDSVAQLNDEVDGEALVAEKGAGPLRV
jgi:hypothetical protein